VKVTSVGFIPAAPLLVPAIAGGSAGLDDDLRRACFAVAKRLTADAPPEVVVVAPTQPTGEWDESRTWDFVGFGVPRSGPVDRPRLPWSLGIGAWLLDEVGWSGSRRYVGVDDAAMADEQAAGDVAVLAIGDGSARRTEKAPGHLDVRAEPYDNEIARLLASGDAVGLATVDRELGDELMCAGRPVWRWLGSLIGTRNVESAELLVHAAPYGVGYFVAEWRL
jgi:hypothetical protein